LASSDETVAVVPLSVNVAAGASSASFTVTTNLVSASTSVTISGAYGGLAKSSLLKVNAIESITIQRAEYARSKKLRVEATSTEPTATLRVYVTATGALIGTLTNNGGGKFSALLPWPTNPQNVTVRSSFGGSASKAVSVK
jgi:hypothetical protein